ncbi:MAG: 50S ribosomal protein L11 methyltransferase [Pseudomonadales bacterium]|nr:50S ribosomal protein L11 methyltransferase [Pseudomonadales bacterium]
MPWQQLTVCVPKALVASTEDLLETLGAVSVSLLDAEDEAVFQLAPGSTPLWSQTAVVGLFPADSSLQALAASVQTATGIPATAMHLESVADQDWERVCMDDFKPIRFGQRLWVCPSWITPPEPDSITIMLDPGLAFGTGTHPTTALCLEWLDAQDLAGKTVIDYGCGSGILAIAAALCGARHVIAIDNDPQAISACLSNRDINAISPDQLQVCLPGVLNPEPADFLLANILSGPLQELTPVLAGLTRPGGKIVLSGVLSAQSEQLLQTYQEYFMLSAPVVRDEWLRIDGQRR